MVVLDWDKGQMAQVPFVDEEIEVFDEYVEICRHPSFRRSRANEQEENSMVEETYSEELPL